MIQSDLDKKNKVFWDEVCGSSLARTIGIKKITLLSLQKYDQAFFKKYPYLKKYVPKNFKNKKVLEIGLGYGSLGQAIASRQVDYHAIDIAPGPVKLMQYRLKKNKKQKNPKVFIASALALPFKDQSFDHLYSIGCFHHTGNRIKSVSEAFRVLKPKGKAIIMLYNRYSLRHLAAIINYLRQKNTRLTFQQYRRSFYDSNLQGEPAPHTDFTSIFAIQNLFKNFSQVKIEIQKINLLPLSLFSGRIIIPKNRLTQKIIRLLGSDLYLTAVK